MEKGGGVMTLQEILRSQRQRLHLSQEQVAQRAEMTLNNYARIERGLSGTTVATMERIAEVLNLRLTLTEKDPC